MGIERLNQVGITDEDVAWVEAIMGFRFNGDRSSVIKNLESIDIQAFPGSGKTTILIAKLAILAKKWPYTNSGICVLSHTNVAREEIEERLGNTDIGKKLLKYPHFIGTLHSFFDTFVALPWIRRVFNLYENNIDDFFDYALERYIGSQSQITVHIAALKALFGFLIDNKWKFSELNGYINTATFRKKLFEKAEKVFNKPILTKEILNEVLLNIDNYLKFKKKNDKRKKNEEKMYLEILIVRLFIKMSLILPIKTGQMLDLCIGDIKNENNRYITYNDIKIKIPNNLRKDILYTIGYVENRNDNIIYKEQDKIFPFLYQCVDKNANPPTVNNTLIKVYKKLQLTEMLQKKPGGKREKYIYPAECYKLTAISNMLETGVNIVYLKKLTGLDIGTLVNGLDFENKIPLKDNVSININSALVMCDYFEYL